MNNSEYFDVTLEDLQNSYDEKISNFSDSFKTQFGALNLKYRKPTLTERDEIVLSVIQKIEEDKQKIAAPERTQVWFNGWKENLDAFVESGGDLSTLVPKFIRANQPIRLFGDYVFPSNTQFEYDFMRLFQRWLFEKYFSDCQNIYEFGCGTGMNLKLMSEIFPEKNLHGLDFVQPAVDLVNKIAEFHQLKLTGSLFDMMHPNRDFKIAPNSGVLTFGSLEQLASKIHPVIDYFIENRPEICVHVEPTVEFFDGNNLFDYLAIKFHRQRGYTEGLVGYLKKKEQEGKIRIIKTKRLSFGSLMNEGYNYIVWKPV